MSSSLVLGSFSLTDPTGTSWKAGVEAEGTSRGGPVPIDVAVQSWLQDGSIVVTQGYDNRTVNIRIRIWATSLTAVSQAEAALFAELGKANLLTWTPSSGPAAVFVVVTSQMVQDDTSGNADLLESQRLIRSYNLELTCEAFTRSAVETVTAALAGSGTTTTLVDNGAATTNWTGSVDGATTSPAVTSGAVGIVTSALTGSHTISLTRTASIATSATPYIVVDWRGPDGGSPTITCYGDGVQLEQIGQTVSPTANFTRTWFKATTSSIAVLRLDSTSIDTPYLGSTARSLLVDNVNRTDVKPTLGTARQLLRSIAVAGSARTPGSLAIEHATSSLGDVLAYFYPDGASGQNAYSPPLRQYRVSGGSTSADSTTVSGTLEAVVSGFSASTVIFDVPVRNLVAGLHLFQVLMGLSGGSTTLTWTVSTRVNGTTVGAIYTKSRSLPTGTGAAVIYTLDRLMLPTIDVDPSATNAVVRITLTATGGSGVGLVLDEAWLFNTAIGQLIQVPCGSGTAASGGSANRIFIEAPTITVPRPTIRIGFAANRSDSFYPTGITSWQVPQINKRVNLLTVTTNALDASVTFRAFNRWHTNPSS